MCSIKLTSYVARFTITLPPSGKFWEFDNVIPSVFRRLLVFSTCVEFYLSAGYLEYFICCFYGLYFVFYATGLIKCLQNAGA